MTPYVTKIKKDKIRTPLPVVYLINVHMYLSHIFAVLGLKTCMKEL